MLTRETYQGGSLAKESRVKGDVWIYRWREPAPDGKRVKRKVIVGSVKEYKTKSLAFRAVATMSLNINTKQSRRGPITVSDLVKHYEAAELGPDRKSKTALTCRVYKWNLKNHVLPQWGTRKAETLTAPEIEAWLYQLNLANGTKAKIRNGMSSVWNHGIRHSLVTLNPIIGQVRGSGVRQSAKRRRDPSVLSAEEISRLLATLKEPFRTMVLLLISTGLRFSELRGLQWGDLDEGNLALNLKRGVVDGEVGIMKSAASRKPVSVTGEVWAALRKLRKDSAYAGNNDWVFASIKARGKVPIWPSSALADHLRPALVRAGITKHVGWHGFRHSGATLLKADGADVKTVQEFLRHATSRITLDTYTQAVSGAVRDAQQRMMSTFDLNQQGDKPGGPYLSPVSNSEAVSC